MLFVIVLETIATYSLAAPPPPLPPLPIHITTNLNFALGVVFGVGVETIHTFLLNFWGGKRGE